MQNLPQEPQEQKKQQAQAEPPATAAPAAEKPKEELPDGIKETFYSKLPFSYKQVDIFVKVMIGLLAAVLIFMVAQGLLN